MRHWLGVGAAVALSVSALSGAQAADRSWTVPGNGLKIATPCARSVDIQPGGDARQIRISAAADHAEEIDQLRVAGGEPATVDAGGVRCGLPGMPSSQRPTLVLTIKVPDGAALDIGDGGAAGYTIGAVGGVLHVSLAGSGGLKAVNAKESTIALSGSGKAEIDSVEGKVTGRLSGAGTLAIGRLRAPSTDFDLSGTGAVRVNDGDAGQLTASVRGAGTLSVPAAAAVKLSDSGSGAIAIKSVKGGLDAELSGSGTLSVDGVESPSVNIQVTGHSNVKLGPGAIASISLSSAGAGDVGIDATVTDANVSAVGAGEIRFAKLTGHISQSSTGAARIVVGK